MRITRKISNVRQTIVDVLTQNASAIFQAHGWAGNHTMENWDRFLKDIYRAARYSRRNEWRGECEDVFLNISR